ncbi:MAG: biotin synthase BioB [Alphaproteobacteria bacterium CG11_big_fil_rev_8_21_14_0_20_39_49]|nr:MAG: biotin synthase BioB [Alphaproteobacteria bacterium CG11_big_fil_rev_8_21_14_0_20_39_49]
MTMNVEHLKNNIRHNWKNQEVEALFALPFNDLVFKAAAVHRENFNPNEVQVSTLLSIKTGACPEDCKYCPQSAHYDTGLKKEPLIDVAKVKGEAQKAKDAGASRFCMGAAWRNLNDRDLPKVEEMISEVKSLGLETCVTLGMVKKEQLSRLKDAGLDYYNHNIDTSEEYYSKIISTRNFSDRLETLKNINEAGLKTCCGGIVGMGETLQDRVKMLSTLANLPEHPESMPINMLVKIEGTPLELEAEIDPFDFIRTIAVARIMMPKSYVRLSAGRENMNDQMQALCFLAGANSIFYGEKLLTTPNPKENEDKKLFSRLGIEIEGVCKQNIKESAVR